MNDNSNRYRNEHASPPTHIDMVKALKPYPDGRLLSTKRKPSATEKWFKAQLAAGKSPADIAGDCDLHTFDLVELICVLLQQD